MTVEELIEYLQTLPGDYKTVVYSEYLDKHFLLTKEGIDVHHYVKEVVI